MIGAANLCDFRRHRREYTLSELGVGFYAKLTPLESNRQLMHLGLE